MEKLDFDKILKLKADIEKNKGPQAFVCSPHAKQEISNSVVQSYDVEPIYQHQIRSICGIAIHELEDMPRDTVLGFSSQKEAIDFISRIKRMRTLGLDTVNYIRNYIQFAKAANV